MCKSEFCSLEKVLSSLKPCSNEKSTHRIDFKYQNGELYNLSIYNKVSEEYLVAYSLYKDIAHNALLVTLNKEREIISQGFTDHENYVYERSRDLFVRYFEGYEGEGSIYLREI